MGWIAGTVTVDEGETIVPGEYRDDYRWNGWLCPRLKRDAVERVFQGIAQDTPDWLIGVDGDTFYLLMHVYADDSEYELDVFEPDEEGWYYVGYMGWCWENGEDWSLPEIPATTFTTTFAECADCGEHLREAGTGVNRHGEGYLLYSCGTEGHEPLASLDIVLEWDEDWTVADDGYGMALVIQHYDNLPTQDVLDFLEVDTREVGMVVKWQDLQDVFGWRRVAQAIKETE